MCASIFFITMLPLFFYDRTVLRSTASFQNGQHTLHYNEQHTSYALLCILITRNSGNFFCPHTLCVSFHFHYIYQVNSLQKNNYPSNNTRAPFFFILHCVYHITKMTIIVFNHMFVHKKTKNIKTETSHYINSFTWAVKQKYNGF